MGEPAVVGRNPELAVWSEVLGSLRDGPLGCVLYGTAGIGKTTLWNAALDVARQPGCQVLAASPAESEIAMSYSGLGDLLADVPPDVLDGLPAHQRAAIDAALHDGEPLPPEVAQHAIRVAVLEIVRTLAAESPVVIGIDDTQWLDPSTAYVVGYVLRHLNHEPVCLLVSLRSDRDELLPFGMEPAFGEERLVRIGLPGLNLGALQQLLTERTGLVVSRTAFRRIAAASGGNPLLALEIARARQDREAGGQEDLDDLVSGRLAALPEATIRALAVVAGLARPTVEQVRAALSDADTVDGGEGDGFEHAVATGLLRVVSDRVRFNHPVFASAVTGALSAAARCELHERLAEVVDDVGERARHLAVATSERDLQVAAKLEAAAGQADRRGAPEAAAELWELAGLRTPEDQAGLRFGRIARAGTSIVHAGEASRARGLLTTAVRRLPSGQVRAQARLDLAGVSFGQGKTREAVSLCRQALLEAGDDRGLRIVGGIRAAWYGTHDVHEQLESAEHAAELLTDDDVSADPELAACVVLLAEQHRFSNGLGLDRERASGAYAMVRPDSLAWPARWARTLWRSLELHADLPAARAACAAELDLAHTVGDESGLGTVGAELADIDCRLGNWRLARQEALRARGFAAAQGQPGRPAYVLGLVDALIGDLDAAQAKARRGLESAAGIDDSWTSAVQLGLLGFVELSRQEHASAVEYFELAEHLVGVIGLAEPARHPFHGDQVEAVVALGDLDRAAQLVERLEQRVKLAPYPWLRVVAARSRGLLRTATGDLEVALAAFDHALRAGEELAMPFERARTLLVQGRLLRRLRDRPGAEAALRAAHAGFDRLGAPVWAGLAEAELT